MFFIWISFSPFTKTILPVLSSSKHQRGLGDLLFNVESWGHFNPYQTATDFLSILSQRFKQLCQSVTDKMQLTMCRWQHLNVVWFLTLAKLTFINVNEHVFKLVLNNATLIKQICDWIIPGDWMNRAGEMKRVFPL